MVLFSDKKNHTFEFAEGSGQRVHYDYQGTYRYDYRTGELILTYLSYKDVLITHDLDTKLILDVPIVIETNIKFIKEKTIFNDETVSNFTIKFTKIPHPAGDKFNFDDFPENHNYDYYTTYYGGFTYLNEFNFVDQLRLFIQNFFGIQKIL